MTGYVLIQTEVGRGVDVTRAVAGVDGVTAADAVTGPYDVIVRVEVPSLRALQRVVVERIQEIDGVSRTLTCSGVHA